MRKHIIYLFILAFVFVGCNRHQNKAGEDNGYVGNVENIANEISVPAQQQQLDPDSLAALKIKIVDNIIYSENLPVVVDFYADWCGPCKQYSPVFHAVAEKYNGAAIFLSINTDEYPGISNAYQVSSIPTTVFILPGGGTLGSEVGVLDEEQLSTYIDQLIATSAGANMSV